MKKQKIYEIERQQNKLSIDILDLIKKNSRNLNDFQVVAVLAEIQYRFLQKKALKGLKYE